MWNAAGIRPRACDELERIAQEADPAAGVWQGSHLPLVQQGITVLGTPLGSVEFVQAHLQKTLADHDTLVVGRHAICLGSVAALRQEPSQLLVESHQT